MPLSKQSKPRNDKNTVRAWPLKVSFEKLGSFRNKNAITFMNERVEIGE